MTARGSVWCALFATMIGLHFGGVGCSDDASSGDGTSAAEFDRRVCEVFCQKVGECGAPINQQSCVQECLADDGSDGTDDGSGSDDGSDDECTPPPTEAQVNACIDAVEAASCQSLLADEEPAACQSLCPDDDTGQDMGVSDTGEADMGIDDFDLTGVDTSGFDTSGLDTSGLDLSGVDVSGGDDTSGQSDVAVDTQGGGCESGNGAIAGSYTVAYQTPTQDTCALTVLFGDPAASTLVITEDGGDAITGSALVLTGVPEGSMTGTVTGAAFTMEAAEPSSFMRAAGTCTFTATQSMSGTFGDGAICGTTVLEMDVSGGIGCTLDGRTCTLALPFEGI